MSATVTPEEIQAEILSKVKGTDNCGVAEVTPSTSLRDLLDRDAFAVEAHEFAFLGPRPRDRIAAWGHQQHRPCVSRHTVAGVSGSRSGTHSRNGRPSSHVAGRSPFGNRFANR